MPSKIFYSILFLCFSDYCVAKNDNTATAADLSVVAAENHLLQYYEDGKYKGPTVEILQVLLTQSQLTADIAFMPWARAFSTTQKVPNTLILSMIRTPEREHQFHWLIKVSQTARVFISLKNKPENLVSNFQQAKSKLIAVIRNTSAHKELVARGFSAQENLYLVPGDKQMISLFVNGRVDLLYTDPNLVLDYLAEHPEQDVEISFNKIAPENQRHSYIAANKSTDNKILARLRVAAVKFQQTPHYRYLLAK